MEEKTERKIAECSEQYLELLRIVREHELLNAAEKCAPWKAIIAPYGMNGIMKRKLLSIPDWKRQFVKIITKKEYAKTLEENRFRVETWKDMHIKLLIGENGALFGSWNFNLEHETKATQRELALYISKENQLYPELCQIFEEMYHTAQCNNGRVD